MISTMRIVAICVCAAFCAFAGTSCGQSEQAREADAAEAAYRDFFASAITGKGTKACAMLTAKAKRSLLEMTGSSSCEAAIDANPQNEVGDLAEALEHFDKVELEVAVNGDTATVTAPEDAHIRGPSKLMKVAGTWYVDG